MHAHDMPSSVISVILHEQERTFTVISSITSTCKRLPIVELFKFKPFSYPSHVQGYSTQKKVSGAYVKLY